MNATNAIALIEDQHEEVKALFKAIESAKSQSEKSKLFEELAANLVAHDAMEREIFYPACEEAMGVTDLLGEALVEHGVVEFSLYVADEARSEDDFDHKAKVLKEMVEHHVREEEGKFLPKAKKALGDDRLEALGKQMKARFEKAKDDDYRAALQKNLQLVLEGVTKAGAANGAKKGKPAKQPRAH